MASYTLIGNVSTIQVTSPLTSVEGVVATIQTNPSGIIAAIVVSQTSFDNDSAAETLTIFADNIEEIISQGKAVGGSGTSSLDNNGLTAYYVTFIVGYDPPGAPPGQVTADVDVPVNLISESDPAINQTLLTEAEDLINSAYEHLVNLSKG